jgi:predicted SAM-dependent methyltransferase
MADEIIKINLGCGAQGIEGWVNIDKDSRLTFGSNSLLKRMAAMASKAMNAKVSFAVTPPPNYMSINLLKGKLPFKDHTVSYCYTSHFLEHLPRHKSAQLLREVHRVMKKGGTLRVVVPDLAIFTEMYAAAKRGDKKAIKFWNEYMKEDFGSMNEKFNFIFAKFASQNNKWEGYGNPILAFAKKVLVADMDHQWMYDFEDLSRLIREAGFSQIRNTGFRKGKTPDLKRLDNRELESIYVEATA